MSVEKTDITQFLRLAQQFPVLDVRSPGEFDHAHIPGALNLPLFTDEERKVVGTAYKQQGRETAIRTGLDYFGPKMRTMVEEAERLLSMAHWEPGTANCPLPTAHWEPGAANRPLPTAHCILVHCWRGGMRSAAVAWLLDLYGFRVYTLAGGYKQFRRHVLGSFSLPMPLKVLGGYTGSGKTRVLKQLAQNGERVIDLETMASHRGSAFGDLGEKPQPSQEMFENILGMELRKQLAVGSSQFDRGNIPTDCPPQTANCQLATASRIWLEDESQRIGQVNIPNEFWTQMRKAAVEFLDIPFEERLDYLVEEYGGFEKEGLLSAIGRMKKRLGGLEAKNATRHLEENKVKECFRILLRYYDKCYDKGLVNREEPRPPVNYLRLEKVEPVATALQLTGAIKQNKTPDLSPV